MSAGALGYIAYGPFENFPNSMYFLPFVSESMTANKNYILGNSIKGRRFEEDMYKGQTMIEGSITIEPTPIQLRRFLSYFCNEVQSDTLVSSHTTWDIAPLNDLVASGQEGNVVLRPDNILDIMVTKAKGDSNTYQSDLFKGCAVKSLNLTCTAGALPTLEIGLIGWGHDFVDSAYTATYDIEDSFTWEQTSYSIGQGNGGYTSVSIAMDNQLEIRKPIGSEVYTEISSAYAADQLFIQYIGNQTVDVTGSVFEYTDERTGWIDNDDVNAVLYIEGPAVETGVNADFTCNMPKMQITEFSNPIPGPGVIETSFTGKGLYNIGSGSQIDFTINTSGTY